MEHTYYKYCIVPLCNNTTVKTPNKIFIHVPENKNRRSKWLRACRRNVGDLSLKNTAIFVCEDHFNIEEDMENYVRFKLMGGRKKMKPDVVPHIFDCQPDRKRSFSVPPRAAAVKRSRRRIIDDAIASTSTQSDSASGNRKSGPQPQTDMDLDFKTGDTSNDTLLQKSYLSKRDVAVQAHPVTVRSKAVQCKLHLGVNVSLSPIKVFEDEEIARKQQKQKTRRSTRKV